MWIIENIDYKEGGPLEIDHTFRLRHFISGHYLSIQYDRTRQKNILSLEPKFDAESVFQFLVIPTAQKPKHEVLKGVSTEAFVIIGHPPTKRYVHIELEKKALMHTLSDSREDEDVFKIFRANANEIWETNFLISCAPLLASYAQLLGDRSKRDAIIKDSLLWKKTEKKLKNVHVCLENLDKFCKNSLLNTSPNQKFGEINTFRQQLLREQYFLDRLCEILKLSIDRKDIEKLESFKAPNSPQNKIQNTSSAKNKNDENERIFIREKIEICKLCYQLLMSITKNNPLNQKAAYNLIDQFQSHLEFFPEAVECYRMIISSNFELVNGITDGLNPKEVFLEKGSSSQNVFSKKTSNLPFDNKDGKKFEVLQKNFVQLFLKLIMKSTEQHKTQKYIQFLRSLCSFDRNGVSKTQEYFFKAFSNNSELKKRAFLNTDKSDEGIRVEIEPGRFVSLKDCFEKSATSDKLIPAERYHKAISYFAEQLRFYADLSISRNYLWKNQLENAFPIKLVFEQISNTDLSLEFRSLFCTLGLALYVDHEPLNPINIPDLCRVFRKDHEIESKKSPILEKHAKLDVQNFQFLGGTIKKLIKNKQNHIYDHYIKDWKVSTKADNFLDDVLLENIIKVLSKVISFNVQEILNNNELYYNIIGDLVLFLEFEIANPLVSIALDQTRLAYEIKKSQSQKKSKVFGLVSSVFGNVASIGSMMMGSGFGNKKTDRGKSTITDDSSDSLYFGNPIMKGLIHLKH